MAVIWMDTIFSGTKLMSLRVSTFLINIIALYVTASASVVMIIFLKNMVVISGHVAVFT
jgi:hypothetical protein